MATVAELTEVQALTIAANLNADTVREQQQEIASLTRKLAVARMALSSVHACKVLTGYEAVETLIEKKFLKREDLTP